LRVIGDGRTLATFQTRAGDPIREFTVNITGVSQLTMEFSWSGNNTGRRFAVVNMMLSADADASTQPNRPRGTYNNAILGRDIMAYRLDNAAELSRPEPIAMIMGADYDHGFTSDGSAWVSSASAFYNLNGQYTSLSGFYGPRDNTDIGSSATLTIFGDERTLATFQVRAGDPIRPFTIDVNGVTQLRLEYSWSGNNTGRRFAVVNMTLSADGNATAQLNRPQGS
jgi:hypothetical protein